MQRYHHVGNLLELGAKHAPFFENSNVLRELREQVSPSGFLEGHWQSRDDSLLEMQKTACWDLAPKLIVTMIRSPLKLL